MENISFKASFTPNLTRKLIRELTIEGFDNKLKYLGRLVTNLKNFPEATIDIVN